MPRSRKLGAAEKVNHAYKEPTVALKRMLESKETKEARAMHSEQEVTGREDELIPIVDDRGGLQRPDKPRVVRLSTASFEDALLDLYYDNNKGPPHLTASELDQLGYNSRCGIEVVHEVLRNPPAQAVSYQRLSRCATKLAVKEMARMPVFGKLEEAWRDYGQAKRQHPQHVRKFFDDFIEMNSKGYQPFVKRANVHLWFWDDETRRRAFKLLWDAHLPTSLFYAFIAHVLTQLPDLGKAYDDLMDEYKLGLTFSERLLAVVEYAGKACTGW